MKLPEKYIDNVGKRNFIKYWAGFFARLVIFIKNKRAIRIAEHNGAKIGIGVSMPIEFAKRLNSNVTIGDHVSILTSEVSGILTPLSIGNNVIIGRDVKLVMGSHRVDTPDFEVFKPNDGLYIGDYVWLCPDSVVLPGVNRIGEGSVLGASSVLYNDLKPMSIAWGHPARVMSERSCVHSNILAESLTACDFESYKLARRLYKLKR